jgi:exosortase
LAFPVPSDSPTTSLALRAKPALLTGVESFVRQWWPLGLFSVLWLDLIRQLSYQWSNREQYAYGWFVPFLALGLLWKRAVDPPEPQSMKPPAWMLCLVAGVLLVLLPVRVIHEINQDWPLFTWPLTLGVVALSLYAVFLLGGWPWVRHFAFPISFILVAIAWPYRIEHGLTQSLMQGVTGLTVTVLGWVDVLASQHGNVIEISTGVVGIDEACSGIRSFQSMLMGALFLGELYRLRWPHRLALIGSGVVVAFCLNVVRTLILTWRASDVGIELIDKWHDPAGLSIFLASFACLWLLAWRMRKKELESRELMVDSPTAKVQGPESKVQSPPVGGLWSGGLSLRSLGPWVPGSLGPTPQVSGFNPHRSGVRFLLSAFCFLLSSFSSLASPRRFLTTVGCCSLCIIGANELWYRAHDLAPVQPVHWWVSYPTNFPSFRAVSVPDSARKLLKYDQAACGAWSEAAGGSWTAYSMRWRPGDPTARMSALGHRPEYCLAGIGLELRSDLGTKYIPAAGLELPFRAYIFNEPQRRLYVFFCLWEDGAEKQAGFGRSKYSDRLRSVLAGRRGLGQQTMEVAISGCATMADAQRAFQQRLPDLVHLEPAQPGHRAGG